MKLRMHGMLLSLVFAAGLSFHSALTRKLTSMTAILMTTISI